MFTSDLTGQLVIDDRNARYSSGDAVHGGRLCRRGYWLRDYKRTPYGKMEFANPYTGALIPRSEWRERIEAMERTKSRLSDTRRAAKLPALHQNGTNYCWFNAFVSGIGVLRAANGLPYVELSSAFGAAQIKNFRNRGGWTGEAIKWLVTKGVCEAKYWPPNAISRKYRTKEAAENALLYRTPEFDELPSNSFEHMMTLLLKRVPVMMGLSWWRHLVCGLDPVALPGGRFGVRILNSHGTSYGDNGEAVLEERKAISHDQLALRTVTPVNTAIDTPYSQAV